MRKPNWGKAFAAHIRQLKFVIESVGELLVSTQKVIFSIKKVWLSVGGSSMLLFIAEKSDWQVITNLIN